MILKGWGFDAYFFRSVVVGFNFWYGGLFDFGWTYCMLMQQWFICFSWRYFSKWYFKFLRADSTRVTYKLFTYRQAYFALWISTLEKIVGLKRYMTKRWHSLFNFLNFCMHMPHTYLMPDCVHEEFVINILYVFNLSNIVLI